MRIRPARRIRFRRRKRCPRRFRQTAGSTGGRGRIVFYQHDIGPAETDQRHRITTDVQGILKFSADVDVCVPVGRDGVDFILKGRPIEGKRLPPIGGLSEAGLEEKQGGNQGDDDGLHGVIGRENVVGV